MFTDLITIGLISLMVSSSFPNGVVLFDNKTLIQSNFGTGYDLYRLTTISDKLLDVLHYNGTDNTALEYPNVTLYSSASKSGNSSYYYNCHSFAWFYEGDVNLISTNTADRFWIEGEGNGIGYLGLRYLYKPNYSSDLCVTSFSHYTNPSNDINPSSLSVGDIIVYYDNITQNIAHSAVVESTSNTLANTMVISKWREYPVYTHKIFDCPYYSPEKQIGPYHFYESQIDVCHISHNYVYQSSTPWYHFYATSCCGRTIKEQHSLAQSGNKWVCTRCGYISSVSPYSLPPEEE